MQTEDKKFIFPQKSERGVNLYGGHKNVLKTRPICLGVEAKLAESPPLSRLM